MECENFQNNGSVIMLILLDISEAFTSLDYGILLNSVCALGFVGTAFQCLPSYLDDHFQKDGVMSSVDNFWQGWSEGEEDQDKSLK